MRLRIVVKPTGDRTEDLGIAVALRRDIWSRLPVEDNAGTAPHGIHRNERGQAYFEFSNHDRENVKTELNKHNYDVDLQETSESIGEECQNCGNIAGSVNPAVCPNCHFRDISSCPFCRQDVPRQSYARISGDLFQCPNCQKRVQLRFNEPMVLSDGTYNQPLVLVSQAQES